MVFNGGCKGGVPGAGRRGAKSFLNFMQFFLEILTKSYVGTPPGPRRVASPSYGESWIRPWVFNVKFLSGQTTCLRTEVSPLGWYENCTVAWFPFHSCECVWIFVICIWLILQILTFQIHPQYFSADNSATELTDPDDDGGIWGPDFRRSALYRYQRPGSNAFSLPSRLGLSE